MDIDKFLLEHKLKTVDLDELKEQFGRIEYIEFYNEIQKLVDNNIITPIKNSSTNGANLFLYKKYKIVSEIEDMSYYLEKINKLHPRIMSNGFLITKPSVYKKYEMQMDMLNRYLWMIYNNILIKISKKERSYQIFGEEKQLDSKEFTFILEKLGLSNEILGYYDTPEECFADYIPERKNTLTLLICENKDIWYNIRRLMFEENKRELFGVNLDGVIYGQGNNITGQRKLIEYSKYLVTDAVKFLYWGDIDKEGLDIFIRLKNTAEVLNIELFIKGYEQMLSLAENINYNQVDASRDRKYDFESIYNCFKNKYKNEIIEIIKNNTRIPQEIVNYETLRMNMR